MIERAVENWLTKTNERNFQTPFCQVLMQQGHRIIYSSTHRSTEQGKDIVTLDRNGDCCAYQLKTGKIDIGVWRKISGQINELVEIPFNHPSVDKSKVHKSYLVTNGEITDEVIRIIDDKNRDNVDKKRNFSYLDTISVSVLLRQFIEAQGQFLPSSLEDLHSFLELFLADGRDFLDKERPFGFLGNQIFGGAVKRKSDATNAISGSVVLAYYLFRPYEVSENHYALFEGWTALAASIVRYAYKSGLKKEDWRPSFDLAFSEILRHLILLRDEVLKRKDFLEGHTLGDGSWMYRARVTLVLGALSALEGRLRHADKNYIPNQRLLALLKEDAQILWFWGESAFPFFFHMIKFLELCGEKAMAAQFLGMMFLAAVNENSHEDQGLPSPYYGVETILELTLNLDTEPLDPRQFVRNSYILEPLIFMIARRNGRRILEENWRRLSHISLYRFIPDNLEDTYTYLAEYGVNYREFPKETQSWQELVNEAHDLSSVPTLVQETKDLIHSLILVLPHRVNKMIIGMLDEDP